VAAQLAASRVVLSSTELANGSGLGPTQSREDN
jgi:hypothetical protein